MMRAALVHAVLWRGFILAALWWVLAGERADSWGVGLVTIAVAATVSVVLMPVGPPRLSLVGLAAFLGFFLFQSLKGGVQVAWIALRAVPDLRPGVRVLALRLPAGAARTLLVNTMSLLPGTLSAGLAGERLRLHVLDVRLPAEAELRAIEARIAVMFGLELEGGRKRE
jgi:multicomponent Na+:H+ antiporter subunit E